jgi:hypothetical protein
MRLSPGWAGNTTSGRLEILAQYPGKVRISVVPLPSRRLPQS